MNTFLGRTLYFDFVCHTTVGAVSDADTTPTVEIFENDTDTAILSPTPVKRTSKTGNYRVSVECTSANGFEIGKFYNIVASATVGGTTSKAVVGTFTVDNIIFKSGIIVSDGSNTATDFKTDLSEATTDYHKDGLLLFTSGSLINQVKKITGYNGSTKFVTTGAFTGTPTAGDSFLILVY